MEALISIALRLTGKKVGFRPQTWVQDESTILVPEGDEEGLLHELLHYVVASDEERQWPNLALDEDDVEQTNPMLPEEEQLQDWVSETPVRREYQVSHLTHKTYALRSWKTPRGSAAWSYNKFTEEDIRWADVRLSKSGTSLEELSAALVTGRSLYGPESYPSPL